MQVSLKLLLYLSPDETCLDDIATYVYGGTHLNAQTRASQAISSLRGNGWKIAIRTHQLDQEQFELVQQMRGYEELFGGRALRPQIVTKFLRKWLHGDDLKTFASSATSAN